MSTISVPLRAVPMREPAVELAATAAWSDAIDTFDILGVTQIMERVVTPVTNLRPN